MNINRPRSFKDEENKEIEIEYMDKPFYHLFVLAVLANWKEMAMTFWERDTDHTCKVFCFLIYER